MNIKGKNDLSRYKKKVWRFLQKIAQVVAGKFARLQEPCLTKLPLTEEIVKQSEKLGLWLYVDGIQTDPERIRNDIISFAQEIILTRPLIGG